MIKGVITDKFDNSALPNANVWLSDSLGKKISPLIGVASDINGNYQLDTSLNPFATHVTASYMGYDKKIIPLSYISSGLIQIIDLPLKESNNILDTFEVVHYKKKKFNTPLIVGGAILALIIGIIIYKKI